MPYITSIFHSIDGEVNGTGGQGMLTTFIRFAGCSLHCWGGKCDTTYSYKQSKEQWMEVDEVVKKVMEIGGDCRRVTITGGEPMEQIGELNLLIDKLKYASISDKEFILYYINLETNGAHNLKLSRRVDSVVLDYKCPSTGVTEKMCLDNYNSYILGDEDWVKFVMADKNDYEHAKAFMTSKLVLNSYEGGAKKAFSPKYGELDPRELVEWMKKDKLYDVKLNLQLHKYIWPELINAGPGKEV